MEKHLHIVALDVPYPPDYGGVFDLFYKLRYLKEEGIKIHLHCFEYGRGVQPALETFCASVEYYERMRGYRSLSLSIPYIVKSRSSDKLLQRLSLDRYPVLLEGIHCTWPLHEGVLQGRKVIIRLHNAEHAYYRQLAANSHSLSKKLFFRYESWLLKSYERSIASKADLLLAVSQKDIQLYQNAFGSNNIAHLPVFIPWESVLTSPGTGNFCLYHGNLSVPENERAAAWLIKKVFHGMDIPFVVAGKQPSPYLQKLALRHSSTCLVANPSEQEMEDLIRKAHIHLLPSMSETGIKLKLLNALFCGKHCIVNDAMVSGTGLESATHIAGNAAGFQSIIAQLYHRPFEDEEIQLRKKMLQHYFDNRENARRLIQWIS